MVERRKAEAILNEFHKKIDGLVKLDGANQRRFQPGPGRINRDLLSRSQMSLLTEGIFMRAFTSYELFMEEVFIFYARGKPTISGDFGTRYISPRDGRHARELLKSGMNFLEWNSPSVIIRRAETYLDGGPIKNAITSHQDKLNIMRRIRNAVAHPSDDAWQQYTKVVQTELRVAPMKMPEPGEFLLLTDPRTPSRYFLINYLSALKAVASVAAN